MINHEVRLFVWPDKDHVEVPVNVFEFPGGELQLKALDELVAKLNTGEDMEYAVYVRGAAPETVLISALVHTAMKAFLPRCAITIAPYLPAGRSDRGALAALETYMHAVAGRSLPYGLFYTLDAHNREAYDQAIHSLGFSANSGSFAVHEIVAAELPVGEYDGIIAPDSGARGRATEVADHLGLPLYTAGKERDFETGKLTKFIAPEDLPVGGHFLVVDDVCDGGGTFAGLIDTINEPLNSYDLWVTHGVFSGAWKSNILPRFENVYTTNSHPNTDTLKRQLHAEDADRVKVIDLIPYLLP